MHKQAPSKIFLQMQDPSKGAKKILNLQSRFASALADTPLKNGCLHIGIRSKL
jgi:hypothetical protein